MDLTEHNLKAALRRKKIGEPVYFFPATDSTNAQAFRLAEAGASEGTVVIADTQTEGRGRMKRTWFAPPALNLYASIILKPSFDAALSSPLTIMAGVAVAELLSSYCPRGVRLKWPNDVLINNRKVSGILTEIKTFGKEVEFVVLGIGININMKRDDCDPSFELIATSLKEETGRDVSRLDLAVRLFDKVGKYYQLLCRGGMAAIRELWIEYAQLLGKYVEVTFGGEVCGGVVAGMDEMGALTITADDGGKRRVIAGDVVIIEGRQCF